MIAEPEIPPPIEKAGESAATPSPGPPDSAQSKPSTTHPYRAKGKIAELPKAQRERINAMLLDGSTYAAVIRKMAEEGVSLNSQNVGNWHNGPGYQRWLKDQQWLEDMRAEQEPGLDLLPD